MSKLTPDTVLHRAPSFIAEVDTSNEAKVHYESRILKFGHDAFALLDLFHTPRTVGQALTLLGPRLKGPRATREALATVVSLHQAGLLRTEPVEGFSSQPFPKGGYDAAFVHIAMLEDPVRKAAFQQAVRETVREGDVVLDLGTGSGILAITAAQAGARKVYAVEPAGMVHLAQRIAERNGVADRIEFIRGWSPQLELPERADVLLTDIVGNEALDMQIWETVHDARRRLLNDSPRLVPGKLTAFATLARIPDAVLDKHRVTQGHLARWKEMYGIDFSPMAESESRRSIGFYERPETVQTWDVLSEPTELYQVDLHQDASASLETRCTLAARDTGEANGVIVHFEARLGPTTTLSTAPWLGCERSHWYTAVWALPDPVKVGPGQELDYAYRYFGDGTSHLEYVGGR
ncbi:50S ribosomal protein L11 methyltransferase [Streptomyces sp. NBC_00525]|uniref:50S ribosomal protein L11 methyltransferase n=1 Tax=Streptomyces sp. NBC_00525 TaxID=2903660 RepID=UPI002E818822|nr:50S ribosomal protein L11 methyltransferase [Streptomyces sp. NBC_00525]WUC94019.1 50S ribosomal protein L11 methyltransferase [Streptomyces sp. NBC_00525]